MRFAIAVLLATVAWAGEAADPLAARLAAGFAAWAAAGGDGKAACALWMDGALPAAAAQADEVIKTLDAVAAKDRKAAPGIIGPFPTTEGGTGATSQIYAVAVEADGKPTLIGFSFASTPPRLAALTTMPGSFSGHARDKLFLRLRVGTHSATPFNPGQRTEHTRQAKQSADPLGPYTITVPAGVRTGKLVVWGPAVGTTIDLPIDAELSLVSVRFVAEPKAVAIVTWTPANGAAGSREIPLIGAVPDASERGTRTSGANTLTSDPKAFEAAEAQGRDPLPKAWSAWFQLTWAGKQALNLTLE